GFSTHLRKKKRNFKTHRDHLRKKKSREEILGTKSIKSIVVADPKKKVRAISYLSTMSTSRSRMLAATLGVLVKKKKVKTQKMSTSRSRMLAATLGVLVKKKKFSKIKTDDDMKIEPRKPVESPLSSLKNEPTGVGAGLENTGNTCFIASVLQCLTHTVPLLQRLLSYKHQDPCNCGNEKFCVLRALKQHMELALFASGKSLSIVDRFRQNLQDVSSVFQINRQEDATEFLESLLGKLQTCLDRQNKSGSVSSQDGNIAEHVFVGRLLSKLRCCNCNFVSDKFEPSRGWSLAIEDGDTLVSALESFICEKQLKLDKVPLVAAFHLKRFKIHEEKISKYIEFPLDLDLLPYMSSNEDPEVPTIYHQYAMVEHIGTGLSSGHYVAYVRSARGTWHRFDDSEVKKISEESVLSKQAYMLFYARQETPWFNKFFEKLKILSEATTLYVSRKSLLGTTCRKKCVSSDHIHQNVSNSNKACNDLAGVSIPSGNNSDFRGDERQDDVFHLAESNRDDDYAFESPTADGLEKPFAETVHQEEPNVYPAGNRATTEDVDDSVPVIKTQEQISSPKRKDPEFEYVQCCKRNFKTHRDHLRKKKSREETLGTKSIKSIFVADPKKKVRAISYLSKMSTSRSRMLAATLGVLVKKKKVAKIKTPKIDDVSSQESL
ncbi:hypothetical protein EUTSA_v10002775mg, partial [Eutrema salsugineum]